MPDGKTGTPPSDWILPVFARFIAWQFRRSLLEFALSPNEYHAMIDEPIYRKKALGAWLGKAVGGTLGAPWEGCRGPLALTFYDPVPTDMVPNDDVDLQVVWACRLATDWRGVVSYANLSDAWQRNIGFALDEYGVAKRNLARGIPAPHSGAYDNAFTDGMGAAIRSEIWALLAPGDPATAARLARVDASVDHAGAGVHAEQFLAALESALFATSDLRAAIAAGLAQIPSDSRLARAIADTIRLCDDGGDFASVRAAILRDRGSENFTDVSMNLSFEVAALLLGGGDFAKTICLAVNCGRDADCTGATVGAILGILDPDAIPDEWLRPIGRSLVLNEGIAGIEPPPTLDALTDLIASLRDRVSIDDAEPPRPDLSRFAIRCRRGLYRPWFAYDCLRARPEEQPLPEEVLLPGNVSTVDFSGLPPESLLLLETDLDLPAAQDALLVVSTTADFRAWLDGEPVLGQECGPFVPAFHRTPANQRKALRLAAGVHKLRIGLAPAGEGMASAPLAFGLAAPADSAWLPDSIYDHPGAVETGCAAG